MRHIPDKNITEELLLTFEAACSADPETLYDRSAWLYVPPFYSDYRYVLGTAGKKPVICVGLNPSTAAPGALDNTLKSVQRVADYNGYDSFLMMNLYAQRATRPKDMDREACSFLHRENLCAFEFLLQKTKVVWAAWGAVMETRGYLLECMKDFVKIGQRQGAVWVNAGKKSIRGHPHHPLYLRSDSVFEVFDVEDYLVQSFPFL